MGHALRRPRNSPGFRPPWSAVVKPIDGVDLRLSYFYHPFSAHVKGRWGLRKWMGGRCSGRPTGAAAVMQDANGQTTERWAASEGSDVLALPLLPHAVLVLPGLAFAFDGQG